MAKFPYEKPLLIDLQKNEAFIGHGECNPGGEISNQGQGWCTSGIDVNSSAPGGCSTGFGQ